MEIARRLEDGQSANEIRTAIADTYGEDVLLTPRSSGFDGLVWVVPVIALVIALAALSATFSRWRRSGTREATDADRALVEQALSDR